MSDSNTHTVKQYTCGNKDTHMITTQYTKDQLQLAAMNIEKATQGEETYNENFLDHSLKMALGKKPEHVAVMIV
jgi:hypothetical protein